MLRTFLLIYLKSQRYFILYTSIAGFSFSQIFEDIKTDSKTIYSVADKIAFMEVLFNKNEHLDHIFHVSKQSKDQLFFKNASIGF